MTTFAALFVPDALREAVSDRAWFEAMVEAERALTPGMDLDTSALDVEALLAEGRAVANPVEPLVRALRAQSPDVHRGATSQDILDTAAMLVARNGVRLILADVEAAGEACAALSERHRSTPMAARTLLQQAVPTTFGYTAAGWLTLLAGARSRLRDLRFPAQLGGAAGTLAAFCDDGPAVVARYAAALGLDEPPLPWHTNRQPVADIAFALDLAAGAAGKVALDVVLLAQTEVGEVREAAGGGSSTMPHKHNPARAVRARACARGVHAQASSLMAGEHELARAAGAWQAEWNALTEALALTGGAVAAARDCLDVLEVDPERMRANLRDEVYSERDALGLEGEYLGATGVFVDRALELWRR